MVAEQSNSAPISNHPPFHETDRTLELLDKFVDSWNNQNTNSPLIPWFQKYISLLCPFKYSLPSKQPILNRQPRDKWMLGNMPRKPDAFPPVNAAVFFPNHFPSFSKPKCTTFCIPPYVKLIMCTTNTIIIILWYYLLNKSTKKNYLLSIY